MTSLSLAELVATSETVAATRSRKAKTAALADLLVKADADEADLVVSLLAGDPRQGRVGVGWAALSRVDPAPAAESSLTIADVDIAISTIAESTGPGSTATRSQILGRLVASATSAEADYLRRLLIGELRQGANEGLVVEGLAKAAGVKAALLRRALMLSGDLGLVARASMAGGADALMSINLDLFRPLRPMLAATAADVAEAVDAVGRASVEWKLDGARIQVHRKGDEVRVWTRNLNEVTGRLPGVVEATLALAADGLVLDGEILGFDESDAPQAFQDTMSSFGTDTGQTWGLRPFFFDIMHRDGADLVDAPLEERVIHLAEVTGGLKIPGVITADPDEAQTVLDEALAAGHEGVMVKGVDSVYEAGRRGKAWRKVKPVHTLDLVVLAVEWGHGRRQGTLSNLHLGARDPDGGFVMVGKTFKGLTDALLTWQTARFLELETHRDGHVVHVRPEQVVEIALDGVQASTRYPGGVALRFARVRGYRNDKRAQDADDIAVVQAMLQ